MLWNNQYVCRAVASENWIMLLPSTKNSWSISRSRLVFVAQLMATKTVTQPFQIYVSWMKQALHEMMLFIFRIFIPISL